MYQISKDFRFEAAHLLEGHDGKCRRLHGHSWLATVTIAGTALVVDGPKAGMLLDFSELKELVQPIVDTYLDHHYLNETLSCARPTSEFVAKWLYEKIKELREDGTLWPGCFIKSVTIHETCTSACTYEEAG